MEFTIILVVVAILGLIIWKSFGKNKDVDPHKGNNPNPNAPTSSKKV
jgi:hypothetical protein